MCCFWCASSSRKPLVDLTIFKNRNFAYGCLLITLFGAAIYGLVTLLPLFYQELMGYTAQLAGIAVSPRGVGAICAMPIIGILTTRMDNRWLIGSGFAIFGICSMWFGEVNLFISQWSFLWAIVLSGFGSGMVFVPLSTTTMGTLANEQDWKCERPLQSVAQCRRECRDFGREHDRGAARTIASK